MATKPVFLKKPGLVATAHLICQLNSLLNRFGTPIALMLVLLQLGCLVRPKNTVAGVPGIDGVGVELWANDGCPAVGDTVTVRSTVTNQSSEMFRAESTDQPVLDLFVGDARWSIGKPLDAALTLFELKPGESKSIEMQYYVSKNFVSVTAHFIPNAQYIEHPVAPYMTLGGCSGFLGP